MASETVEVFCETCSKPFKAPRQIWETITALHGHWVCDECVADAFVGLVKVRKLEQK